MWYFWDFGSLCLGSRWVFQLVVTWHSAVSRWKLLPMRHVAANTEQDGGTRREGLQLCRSSSVKLRIRLQYITKTSVPFGWKLWYWLQISHYSQIFRQCLEIFRNFIENFRRFYWEFRPFFEIFVSKRVFSRQPIESCWPRFQTV